MEHVKQLQEKIFELKTDYITIERNLQRSGLDKTEEDWIVYTPEISRKHFKTKEALVAFLEGYAMPNKEKNNGIT